MSETLAPQAEQQEHLLEASEKHELLTAQAETAKAETPAKRQERLIEAREQAREHAQSSKAVEQLKAAQTAAPAPDVRHTVNRELKAITLRRELQLIRRKLPAPQRALSNVIHQPVVRAISEATGKTVSRPSGLLGGGLVAFIGTATYYYLARHIGFTYNHFAFIVLFIGGFALGLVLELLVYLATASHRKADS
jgi:hypothetical protein